jgi:hypothetical protein
MWTLLTVAVGGYITSRGVEKGIKIWKGRDESPVFLAENMKDIPDSTSEGTPLDEGEFSAENEDDLA